MNRKSKLTGTVIVLSIVFVVASLLFWRPRRAWVPEKIITVSDGQLVDGNTSQGQARKQQDGNLWRVFVSVQLPTPATREYYHGWMLTPDDLTRRYAGQFFPVQDGQYSLTFTTEEDLAKFSTFQVSEESVEMPTEPSNIKRQWEFH